MIITANMFCLFPSPDHPRHDEKTSLPPRSHPFQKTDTKTEILPTMQWLLTQTTGLSECCEQGQRSEIKTEMAVYSEPCQQY